MTNEEQRLLAQRDVVIQKLLDSLDESGDIGRPTTPADLDRLLTAIERHEVAVPDWLQQFFNRLEGRPTVTTEAAPAAPVPPVGEQQSGGGVRAWVSEVYGGEEAARVMVERIRQAAGNGEVLDLLDGGVSG